MKMSFSKWLATAVIGFAIVAANMASAENNNGNSAGTGTRAGQNNAQVRKEQVAEKICTRLTDLFSKIGQRMENRTEKVRSRIQTREQTRLERRTNHLDKLADFRKKRDERRNEYYQKLEERAKTDGQKAAVAKFQAQMEAAIATRKSAIDAAITDFQKALDSAISERTTSASSAATSFQAAVETALKAAQASCEDGGDPNTVRTTLRAALQAGKDKFQAERKNYEGLKTTLETLTATRRQAVQKAIDDFKVSADKAIAELKAAFPETGSSGT